MNAFERLYSGEPTSISQDRHFQTQEYADWLRLNKPGPWPVFRDYELAKRAKTGKKTRHRVRNQAGLKKVEHNKNSITIGTRKDSDRRRAMSLAAI